MYITSPQLCFVFTGRRYLLLRVPHAQDMAGLLLDTCNNFVWEGWSEFEVPSAKLSPPTGGDQTANVVVTGDSSGIVFQNCEIMPGAGARGYDI